MSFFREVAESLGFEPAGGYTVIDYGGDAVYIEGVRRVLSIEPTRLRLDCGKVRIELSGEKLTVSELGGGCITVTGKVRSIAEDDPRA